jgi:hypothetical protein
MFQGIGQAKRSFCLIVKDFKTCINKTHCTMYSVVSFLTGKSVFRLVYKHLSNIIISNVLHLCCESYIFSNVEHLHINLTCT